MAYSSISVNSNATEEGAEASTYSESSADGNATVIVASDAQAENKRGRAISGQLGALLTSDFGRADSTVHTSSKVNKHGSDVKSSIEGNAEDGAIVDHSIGNLAEGSSVSHGGALLNLYGGKHSAAHGRVGGRSRGNRKMVKSKLDADGSAKGDGIVYAGGEFGSLGGRKRRPLSDLASGTLHLYVGSSLPSESEN